MYSIPHGQRTATSNPKTQKSKTIVKIEYTKKTQNAKLTNKKYKTSQKKRIG